MPDEENKKPEEWKPEEQSVGEEVNPPTVSTVESPLVDFVMTEPPPIDIADDPPEITSPLTGPLDFDYLKDLDLTKDQIKFVLLFVKHNCMRMVTYRAMGKSGVQVRKWEAENPDFKTALFEAREGLIDWAESMLLKKIMRGNLTAIIFFLKCQAKHRGYVERSVMEIEGQMQKINTLVSGIASTIKDEIKDEKTRVAVTNRLNQSLNDFLV